MSLLSTTSQPIFVILIGISLPHSEWHISDSINELQELATTAGLVTKATLTQARTRPHPKHYFGAGKLVELETLIHQHKATIIICDDELTPSQHKFLESKFKLKILDRTSLILDIFSQRAQTYEAQLQVEYAQLNYLLPRLTRLWTHLSRQGGGIGSRGPGETQLEVDKRQIRRRMTHIKSKLKKVQSQRQLRRQKRDDVPTLSCVLVGYTNAGKSSIMNQLTRANVLSEDKLFATLDPTSRRFKLPNSQEIVITDTVGFIQKLPHHLVNAFYSTLEEVTQANVILHVIDCAHPNLLNVIKTAQTIISDLHAKNIPTLYVFNKWDLVQKKNHIQSLLSSCTPSVFVSALSQESLAPLFDQLMQIIQQFHQTYHWDIPYSKTNIMNLIRTHGHILNESYEDAYIKVTATLTPSYAEKIMNHLYQN